VARTLRAPLLANRRSRARPAKETVQPGHAGRPRGRGARRDCAPSRRRITGGPLRIIAKRLTIESVQTQEQASVRGCAFGDSLGYSRRERLAGNDDRQREGL
jgi:hypothetical protein